MNNNTKKQKYEVELIWIGKYEDLKKEKKERF